MNLYKTTMMNTSINRVTTLATALLLASSLTACHKFAKSDNSHKPAPLVTIKNGHSVLSPLFAQSSSQKLRSHFSVGHLNPFAKSNKSTLAQKATAFKTAIDNQGYVNANASGLVQAFDTQGKQIWQRQFKQGLTAGVSLDNQGRVAIISDTKGKVIALDRTTGNSIWQSQLDSLVLAPALVSQNRVITLENNGVITAQSLESGNVIWKFGTQNPTLSVRGSAMPLMLDSKTVIVSTADGRIHALNVDDGVPIWSRRFSISQGASDIERLSDIDATPVLNGSTLYVVTYSGQLVAADMASRQLSFVKDFASIKSVAVDDTHVYVATLNGELVALDKMTGNIIWQSDSLAYRGLSNPVTTSNYLIVGDALGYIHVLDKVTGNIIDRQQAKVDVTQLQYTNQRLIAQSANGDFSIWQINS